MVERRDVELLIKAKDLSTRPLKDVARAIDGISASLEEQVSAARRGEISYQELAASLKQVQEAGRALAGAASGIRQFQNIGDQSARLADRLRAASVALRGYRDSLGANGPATAKQQRELRSLESVYTAAQKAFEKNQAALSASSERLAEAGVDTRNLTAAQQQIVTSATTAGQAATTLSTAMAGYARNAREAASASRALRSETSFKKLADDANEAVQAAQRLATATSSVRPMQTGATSSLRELIDPAAQARSTLAGLERQIEETGAAVAKIDGPFKGYEVTLAEIAAAQRRLLAVGGLVDRFQAQTAAVRSARAAFVEARNGVRTYEAQVRSSAAPNDDLVRKLRDAQTALREAAREFRAQATAARDTQVQLRQAGVDTAKLAQEQDRLSRAAATTTTVATRLNEAFARFGRSNRGDGIFGLSPYAIQNLGFQINDLFTQIAGGTSVTQAFAQQGGQILQVFGPGAFSAVARWIPMLAALAAAIGTAAAALSRLQDTSSSTRNFEGLLTLRGGSNTFALTAQQLTDIARRVEALGVSFSDARKAVVDFMNAGVVSTNLESAVELAVRFARVTGQDIPAATQLFVRGLTEGRDGFNELLRVLPVFNDETRQTVTALLDQGRAGDAQRVILDALRGAVIQADQQAMSPFRQSMIELTNAWKEALDELGKTGIITALQGAMNSLAGAGRDLARVFRMLRGEVGSISELTDLQRVRTLRATQESAVRETEAAIAQGPTWFLPGSRGRHEQMQRDLPAMRAELERLRQEEARLVGGGSGGTSTPDPAASDRERARALSGQIDALQRVVDLRRQEATIADKNAREEDRRTAVRQRATARVTATAPRAGETEQGRRLIQQEIDADMRDFDRKLAEERQSAGNSAAAQIRRDFQAITNDITATVRARDEAIRGIQEDVAAGSATPAQAIERIQQAADQARPALQRLVEEAKRFRDQQSGDTVRRAAMTAQIATAERQAGALGSRQGIGQVLQTSQQEVQRLLQERAQFVQTQDALVRQGAITQSQAQQSIQDQYRTTNEAIRQNIDAYEAASQAAATNGAITQGQAQNNAAAVQLWRAQLEYVDPAMARLRQGIDDTVVQAGTTAFNSLAEGIGNVIANVSSLGEGFKSAGQAALQFVADVLKGIAQIILREQLLIAIQTIRKALSGGTGDIAKAPVGHMGGVVGGGLGVSRQRRVNPYWFANAPRMHDGGVVGLRPDEQAAILQRGEEVLTRNDPRNVLNRGRGETGSGGQGGTTAVRNVLAVGDDEIANAMSGAPGERVIMNILRRNAPTVRTLLRGS